MSAILRVKLRWSGFQGAPGLSVFHFQSNETMGGFGPDAQSAVSMIENFATAIGPKIPSGVSLQCAPDIELIEATTGALLDVANVTVQNPVTNNGAVGQSYAAAAGAVINWRTSTVRGRRRVRGRTFLVPLSGVAFEANGTLSGDTIQKLSDAATALVNNPSGPEFGVYARPTVVKPVNQPPIHQNDGMFAPATSSSVPDMSAILRSRRD